MNRTKKIVVVGGGISGLTTAFYLSEAMRQGKMPVSEITLLEGDHRLGGVIRTERKDGFLFEYGPDSFISEKPAVLNLCHQLGIENQIIGTRPEYRGSSIFHEGRLLSIPEGFYMLAPVDPAVIWSSPLLSWKGKLRLLAEPFIPASKKEGDESLASFVSRRFGDEVLERIAQPMLGNIYGGDLKDISLLASMPRLREMEKNYGSVARAILARRKLKPAAQDPNRPKYGMFLSFIDGMETLVRKLLISLVQVRIRTSTKVREVRSEGFGWHVLLEDGSKMEADLLCLALPGTQAARILKSTDGALAGALEQIPYRSMTTLHLGLRGTSLLRPYNQYGFMISPEKASAVLSASFASNKFVNRAPGDFHQIRVFGVEGLMQGKGPEAERVAGQKLWDEITKILDIVDSAPSLSTLTHWEEAIPRYRLGHLEQVARIEIEAARRPSLFLTGNAFRGVGISDCVRQAEETAQKMVAFLKLGAAVPEGVENSEPFLPTCCG